MAMTGIRPRLSERPSYYVALLTVAMLLNYLDRSIFAVLLIPIKGELQLTDVDIGLLTGFGFTLFYALAGIPLARIADRGGRHLIIAGGMLVWSLSTAGAGLAGSVTVLLLARAAVGIGEAAGTASAYALAADQDPKARRPFVLGIVSAGGAVGTALGLSLGSLIASAYGWRAAFFLAGLPGVVLTMLLWTTLQDRRPGPAATPLQDAMPGVGETLRFIAGQRSILLTLGGSIALGELIMVTTGWSPAYFARVFGLPLTQIGITLGLIKGAMGVTGTLAGGFVTARLARRSQHWQAAAPGIACLLACPAFFLFLSSRDPDLAFAGLGVGIFFMSAALGPVLSVYQCASLPRLRSQVTALHMLIASIGMGLGPLLVGLLNDGLFLDRGSSALRYSLMILPIAGLVAGALFIAASLFLARDMERADRHRLASP